MSGLSIRHRKRVACNECAMVTNPGGLVTHQMSSGHHGSHEVPFETPTPDRAVLVRAGFEDRACRVCGWRFFTTHAQHAHEWVCAEERAQAVLDARVRSAQRRTGLMVTALNNSRRVRCADCDKVSTPSGIALHQQRFRHTGRVEEEARTDGAA